MAVEFIRLEMPTKMDGKKLWELFCLMIILMAIGIDAEFPDLSRLIFEFQSDSDGGKMQIQHPFKADSVKVSCGGCQKSVDKYKTIITCNQDSFIAMSIGIVLEGTEYDIPLNFTCNDNKNKNKIVGLNATFVGNKNVFLSWKEMDDIDHYVVIVMDKRMMRLMKGNAQFNTLNITDLAERTLHQACIASVDKTCRTSEYVCLRFEINLRVQKEEGESQSVSSIRVEKYETPYLLVSFKEPDRPNGIISSYRIRVYLTMDSICQQENEQIIKEMNRTETSGSIDVGILKPCRKYRIEVAAVNGWRKNGGVGRSASVDYTHQAVEILSVEAEFMSPSLFKISWHNKKSLCNNSVILVRIRNSGEESSCVTYVVSDRKCEGIKQFIPSDNKCSDNFYEVDTTFQSKGMLMIIPKVEQQHTRKFVVSIWMFSDALRLVMPPKDLTAPNSFVSDMWFLLFFSGYFLIICTFGVAVCRNIKKKKKHSKDEPRLNDTKKRPMITLIQTDVSHPNVNATT